MDDEEVALGFDGHACHGEGAIHGSPDLPDRTAAFELQTVLGTVPVPETGRREQVIGDCDEVPKGGGGLGHGRGARRSGFDGIRSEPEFLGGDADEEAGVVGEVPFPEASGFAGEPVEPFETAALDPARGLADAAGVEVESSTDTEKDGGGKAGPVGGHESFLLRRAESDPEEIRSAGGHLIDECGVLGGGQGAEGRREGADDADTRETLLEAGLQFLGDAGVAAVEEVGCPGILAPGEDPFHQVGSVDAAHGAVACETAQPDHGHAVRGGEERTVVDATEVWISLGFHDAMDTRDADVARRPGADGGDEGVEG